MRHYSTQGKKKLNYEGDMIMILRRVSTSVRFLNKLLIIRLRNQDGEEFLLRENLNIDLDAGMKGMYEQLMVQC